MSETPLNEQELADQLRRARIEDMLVSVLFSVSSLGFRRLGATPDTAEERDLGQVKLAIDTMDALAAVLEPVVPAQLVSDLRSSAAGLKLAYAQAATTQPSPAADAGATPAGAEPASDAESNEPSRESDDDG